MIIVAPALRCRKDSAPLRSTRSSVTGQPPSRDTFQFSGRSPTVMAPPLNPRHASTAAADTATPHHPVTFGRHSHPADSFTISPGSRFIRGEPMKFATHCVAGVS